MMIFAVIRKAFIITIAAAMNIHLAKVNNFIAFPSKVHGNFFTIAILSGRKTNNHFSHISHHSFINSITHILSPAAKIRKNRHSR